MGVRWYLVAALSLSCASSEIDMPGQGAAGTRGGGGVSGGAGDSGAAGSSGAAGTTGGAGMLGTAGITGAAGQGGTAGVAAGGRGGTGGAAAGGRGGAAGGPAGRGGAAGAAGAAMTGQAGAGGAPSACAPCGTHRWACWPMPNPASSGLPNPASYRDNSDGTVTDNVTCLTWQKAAGPATYTVDAGRAYCAGLGAGWRMATRIELASVNDFTASGAKFPAPLTNTGGFFKTGSEWVLTTKQIGAGAGTDFGWAYNFSDGIVSNARSGATADRVRCVRGGGDDLLDAAPGALAVPPPNQYTMVSTDEIRDNYTGLVWQRSDSSQTTMAMVMPWADARAYCAGLTTGGHTWRLPSIRELATLVDEAQVAPSINRTMFPNTKYGSKSNNWYWASHQAAGSTTAAWALNFDDGFTGFNAGASGAWNYFTGAWVKCVR